MSPSDQPALPDSKSVPPEVLAIAVALAVEWQAAEGADDTPPDPPSRWRWAGRRWERPADHRWS